VERYIASLIALEDDEKLFARIERVDDLLDRHEYHVHRLYARSEIGFESYDHAFKKIRKMRLELHRCVGIRRRQLRDEIIPEVKNLCTQADRDAA
jgi:glutamine synthetase adenylyltransferase